MATENTSNWFVSSLISFFEGISNFFSQSVESCCKISCPGPCMFEECASCCAATSGVLCTGVDMACDGAGMFCESCCQVCEICEACNC